MIRTGNQPVGLHQHFLNFQIPAHPQAPMLSLAAATPPLSSPEISARAVSLAMGMPKLAPGISTFMEKAAVQVLPMLLLMPNKDAQAL